MHTGNPPGDRLYTLSDEDLIDASTQTSDLTLQDVRVTGLPTTVRTFKIQISAGNYEKELQTLTVLKGPQQEWSGINLKIESRTTNYLRFKLVEKKVCFCFAKSVTLGECTHILSPEACGPNSDECSREVSKSFRFSHSTEVSFRGIQHSPIRGPCWLFLNMGQYETVVDSEVLEQLWHPVSFPNLKPGVENLCHVATHQLMKQNLQVIFTVRLIHSLPLLCSAIQVFYQDKICVVARLISEDEMLKLLQQKGSEKCEIKNACTREKAVLIKNKQGDWAVVKGHWVVNRKGASGSGRKSGQRDVPRPVPLSMQVYKMSTGCWQDITGYIRQKNTVTCTFDSLFVDLKQGYLQVQETSTEVVEYIALAFSISLLHLLCQPKAPGTPDDQDGNLDRGLGPVQSVPSSQLMFVEAVGSKCSTPSNHYISHAYGDSTACSGEGLWHFDDPAKPESMLILEGTA